MNKKLYQSIVALLCVMVLTLSGAVRVNAEQNPPTPQTNFYEYINQEWLKKSKIPENEASLNNFTELITKTDKNLREMVANMVKESEKYQDGSAEKKLLDLYRMALDFETRNKLGAEPIKQGLEEIRSVKDIDEMRALMVKSYAKGLKTFVNFSVNEDVKNTNANALYLDTARPFLSKVNHENDNEYANAQKEAFKTCLKESFLFAGNSEEEAARKTDLVFDLDKKIAAAQVPAEMQDDEEARYNVKNWEEIKALAPNLPTTEIAKTYQMDVAKTAILPEPSVLTAVSELFQAENLEALKAHMEFTLIAANFSLLSEDLLAISTRLEAAATGVMPNTSKDEQAYMLAQSVFSDLIGKLYVEKYFMPSAKEDVKNMVAEIKSAYKERLQNLDWMSEQTKKHALEKLDTMRVKIAYPDTWEDYSDLNILSTENGGSLSSNFEAISASDLKKMVKKLQEKPDKNKWGMPPQMVNAYYNPISNEIVFPAAILQPPFYDPKASREENLGGIGAVIGHEITHAFDKRGSQFDKDGNLVNWWTKEDLEKFQKKVDQAADIYSKLEVSPGYYVNGKISTGEIIADLGGLTIAVEIAKKNGLDTKKIFESYAKVWRALTTKEFAIANLEDEHPPGIYRVNNIVNQIDQFYEDFNVKEGDPMYVAPKDRLRVW